VHGRPLCGSHMIASDRFQVRLGCSAACTAQTMLISSVTLPLNGVVDYAGWSRRNAELLADTLVEIVDGRDLGIGTEGGLEASNLSDAAC